MSGKRNILTTYADSGGSTGGGGGGSSVLMYGSSGAEVKRLQELLNSLGYNAGTPDGIFGAQTQAAVTQMQKDAGITADGIVGANTWNKISTATPVTNPPAVKPQAVAYDDGTSGKSTTPAAERVNTATGTPNTMEVKPSAVSFDDGVPMKPASTSETPAPQSDISVPDYTSTLASLGIINNAAQEKNQQYSGAVFNGGGNSGISSTAGVKPTPVYFDDGTTVKTPSTSVTPKSTAGVKPTPVYFDDGTTVKTPSTSDAPKSSSGVKPTPVYFDDGTKATPKQDPPAYDPPAYNPPSTGAAGGVQAYSGIGPTGGNSYSYSQDTKAGGGSVPAAPSGTENAGTVDPVLESYTAALNALDNAGTGDPGSPKYDDDLYAIYEKITGRGPFRYDINEDMLYRQYAQQYTDQGRLAMEDAMGRAAALTGGYGSSYAQSVGQQTYDSYLQRLNEVIPELYDRRYQAWQDEGTQLERQYNLLGDLKDREAAAEAAAYEREIDARDYALKLSEIAREQGNLDREYELDEWQAIQAQNNELWNQGYKDRALAYDQYNADREFGLKQWSAEQDAYYQGLNYQLKQQELFYDQANADRNYELSVQKILADIESDQKEKAVDISEDPYQVMADKLDGLRQAGVKDGAEAYQVLLAQGMKDDQAQAYANLFEGWGFDTSTAWDPESSGLAYGYGGQAVHRDMTPMSSGYTDVWKNARNMFDTGSGKDKIASYLSKALDKGKITDHEVDIILDELGI